MTPLPSRSGAGFAIAGDRCTVRLTLENVGYILVRSSLGEAFFPLAGIAVEGSALVCHRADGLAATFGLAPESGGAAAQALARLEDASRAMASIEDDLHDLIAAREPTSEVLGVPYDAVAPAVALVVLDGSSPCEAVARARAAVEHELAGGPGALDWWWDGLAQVLEGVAVRTA